MSRSATRRSITFAWSRRCALSSCFAGRNTQRVGIAGKRTVSFFFPWKNSCGTVVGLRCFDSKNLETQCYVVM